MRIDIVSEQENDDGSLDLQLEIDEEAKTFLLQEGFMAILMRAAQRVVDSQPLLPKEG